MASITALRVSRPVLAAAATIPVAYYAYNRSFGAPSAKADSPNKVFSGGISFVNLKLQSSEQVNHDTKRLRFELPKETDVSGLNVISAVLTKANINGAWIPTFRPYTPISDPDIPGHIDLLVKRYPTGSMSVHLHSLKPGDTQSFASKPLADFAYTPNAVSHALLIAGGAGITPLYQLAQRIVSNPEDRTRVTLVFGVNTDEDLLFREQFAKMESAFPGRFRCVYTVTNPEVGSRNRKGRVNAELLKEVAPGPEMEGVKVFFCGPPAMEEAVAGKKGFGGSQGSLGGVLKELGFTKEQVHKL